jgi:hypothetical protein
MKQGWDGYGGNKALRGLKNLRVQHSRERQSRCRSIPVSKALEGRKTSGESVWISRFHLCWLERRMAQDGSNVRVGRKVKRGKSFFLESLIYGLVRNTSGCSLFKRKHVEGSV